MFEDLEAGDPASGAEGSPSVPKRNAPVPQLIPADFDLRQLLRRPFVLGNRFMAGVVTLGVGPAGTGKSNLAILSGARHPLDLPLHHHSCSPNVLRSSTGLKVRHQH